LRGKFNNSEEGELQKSLDLDMKRVLKNELDTGNETKGWDPVGKTWPDMVV
jgi:hypothetical protein